MDRHNSRSRDRSRHDDDRRRKIDTKKRYASDSESDDRGHRSYRNSRRDDRDRRDDRERRHRRRSNSRERRKDAYDFSDDDDHRRGKAREVKDVGKDHRTHMIDGRIDLNLPEEEGQRETLGTSVRTQTRKPLHQRRKQSKLRKRSLASSHQEFLLSIRTNSMASCLSLRSLSTQHLLLMNLGDSIRSKVSKHLSLSA